MTDEHSELQALIERNLREAARTEALAREITPRLEAIVGRGRSRAGVRAFVDHRGLLTDLALSPASLDLPLEDLGAEVLAGVADAITDAQGQAAPLQALLAPHARSLDDTTVLDALDDLLGPPDATPPPGPTPPPAGTRPPTAPSHAPTGGLT